MRHELRSAFRTRQYMLSKDFEIFYYSDVHFKPVSPHAHDYYEFYLFLEGEVTMVIDHKKYPLKPGDMVLVPPGIQHHAVINDSNIPYRRFIFWVSQSYTNALTKQSLDYLYLLQQAAVHQKYLYHFSATSFNAVQNRILKLLEEATSDRYGRDTAMSIDVNDLILYLNRIVYESQHPVIEEEQNLLQDLSSYLDHHLDEELSLDQLADQFFVSKYYISHLFKETYGISIHQCIMKKRLDACRAALLAGGKPSHVYEDFGIHDYSSFFRAFRKEYGMSPKEYQDVYLKDPERSTVPHKK